MIDQYGRSINYLRLSVTDKCNLSCQYCIHKDCDEKIEHEELLSFEEMNQVVGILGELGIEKVRIAGGEPLLRANIEHLIALLCRHGAINEVVMTTNGTYLAEKAQQLKLAGLKRVNVNLNTLNAERYKDMTNGGDLNTILKGIEVAKQVGLTPIKINVCIMKGVNEDELMDFVNLTQNENVEVRFVEWIPENTHHELGKYLFIANEALMKRIPGLIPVPNKDQTSAVKFFNLPESKGKVGFISPVSQSFCGICNCIRLTADGFLKRCLHDKEEVAIKQMLGNERLLEHVLRRSIFQKDESCRFEDVVLENAIE